MVDWTQVQELGPSLSVLGNTWVFARGRAGWRDQDGRRNRCWSGHWPLVRVVRVIGWCYLKSGGLGHELADHLTQLICIWIFICISMYYLKCNISDMTTTENNLKQNTLYSRDIIDFQFFSDFQILLSWYWFFYLLNTLHLIWAFSCWMVGCVVSILLYPDLFLLWYNPLQLGFELLVRPLQEVDLLPVLLLLALNIFFIKLCPIICSSLLPIKRELSFAQKKECFVRAR